LGLAFTLATRGGWQFFIVALVTVGVGFVGHELAHKYAAMRFGYSASYRIWPMGLVLALILAFVARLIFAALGAVQIYGPGMSRDERGVISLSGPVFNVALAAVFMGLAALFGGGFYGFFNFGAQINALIALFNCIPFAILDGKKIFDWDKSVWLLAVGAAGTLFLMTWF
jgi:Zn-dependent protease